MTGQAYEVYDFRSASASDAKATTLRQWIEKSSTTFAQIWQEFGDGDTSLKFCSVRTETYDTVIRRAAKTNVGCFVKLGDEPLLSIWHVTTESMHQINAVMLQSAEEEELPDRELSSVELSLGKLFFELVADALSKAWLNQNPLEFEVGEFTIDPSLIRHFRSNDLVVDNSFEVVFSRGSVTFHWITAKEPFEQMLETAIPGPKISQPIHDPRPIVEQVPVNVVGVLGESKVSMEKLAELKSGDLLMLNQRIDRPVSAMVNGRAFLQCWPGRMGVTQGLEVVGCV